MHGKPRLPNQLAVWTCTSKYYDVIEIAAEILLKPIPELNGAV